MRDEDIYLTDSFMGLELKNLMRRLTPSSCQALEAAAALCIQKTNYHIELEHFLYKLLQQSLDMEILLRYYEIDREAVQRHLLKGIDKLKKGSTSSPSLSPHIIKLLKTAWMIASIHLNEEYIRPATLLLALIDNDSLRGILLESCPLILRLPRHALHQDLVEQRHTHLTNQDHFCSGVKEVSDPHALERSLFPLKGCLEKYTLNLTDPKVLKNIPPILGREREIHQLIQTLLGHKQQNILLVGDTGVGKTALVKGLAKKIEAKEVPFSLQKSQISFLDLTFTHKKKESVKNIILSILDEIKHPSQSTLLFIKGISSLPSSSKEFSAYDLLHLIKSNLNQENRRFIFALTEQEYKRYIENDFFFIKNFTLIQVTEPSLETAIMMIRSLISPLEKHHGIQILNEAIETAVTLSHQFLPHRRLPEKAIYLLDKSCGEVALSRESPPLLRELNSQLSLLEVESEMLRREEKHYYTHDERLQEIQDQIQSITLKIQKAQNTWHQITELTHQMESLSSHLSRGDLFSSESLSDELKNLETSIKTLCHELNVSLKVDKNCVTQTLSHWANLPPSPLLTTVL